MEGRGQVRRRHSRRLAFRGLGCRQMEASGYGTNAIFRGMEGTSAVNYGMPNSVPRQRHDHEDWSTRRCHPLRADNASCVDKVAGCALRIRRKVAAIRWSNGVLAIRTRR